MENAVHVQFIVGSREGLRKVREFTIRLLTETEKRTDLTPVQKTATGLLDRTSCWLATLEALDRPLHYQGHLSALRSMIEISVDLALLCIDPSRNAQLEAWEQSAKYKHAKEFAAYARSVNTRQLMNPLRAEQFVIDVGAQVAAARAQYWNGKHPNRWTNNNLLKDVEVVDAKFPKMLLLRLYQGLYRYLCFMIHGSALAGRRGHTPEQILSPIGIAFKECSDLSLACIELAQRLLGRFDAEMQKALKETHDARTLAFGGYEVVDGELQPVRRGPEG